jgi:sorbitol-specific phosphotransferase system component IIC
MTDVTIDMMTGVIAMMTIVTMMMTAAIGGIGKREVTSISIARPDLSYSNFPCIFP